MRRCGKLCLIGVLACAVTGLWAQDDSTSSSGAANGSQTQQPVPAYGQENAPTPITENPPISGMDTPSLEPHAAPLSYLQPGATFSESADSNVAETPGTKSQFTSVTRGLGSLVLRRLWSHYDLGLDYVGGAAYYDLKGEGWRTLQEMDLAQKVTWKRGQFAVRDSFSYLPEGNFGASYGALGSEGMQSLGTTAFSSFWGGSGLGSLGLAPRIMNVSLADVSETLSPKSSVTAAGGYAFTHFYGDQSNGAPFLASSQVSFQGGYDRTLTSHTQVALVYGYQAFDFNVFGTAFHSNIIEGLYGRRITGRMDLIIAAGPQFTRIGIPCTLLDALLKEPGCSINQSGQPVGSIPNSRIGVAGQFRLRYRFPKTALELRYERFETSGSGLLAGAQTDLVRVGATRPLNRIWSGEVDLGFSRNSRLQPLNAAQQQNCVYPGQPNPNSLPPCPGVAANVYDYGYAGFALHRQFGRTLHGYASFQFNELYFDEAYCGSLPACNRISNRDVVTFGVDWTPRPIRVD